MDALSQADAIHRNRMAKGSLWLLNAIEQTYPGAKPIARKCLPGPDLVWSDTTGVGSFAPEGLSQTAQRQTKLAVASIEREQAVLARKVRRDPCPRCGVRGDIGCKHRPVSSNELLTNPDYVNAAWDRAFADARQQDRRDAA